MPRGEDVGEIWHLESQRRVVFLYIECSLERLKQPAGAGHRLEQPVVGNHFREGEVKAQPMQLCVALSVDSFCAALRRLSLGELGIWSLHQKSLWEPSH